MDRFLKIFALTKVDIPQRMVYGLVTAEVEDKDHEVCDYETTKPEYQKVNEEMGKASDGQNIMPLREMHGLSAVGAGKSIEFDDTRKQIRMAFKVVDDSAWKKVCEKVLLGFSQGGRYIKKWKQDGKDFYTAQPGEVSLVDNPCLPGAYIEYAKADGSVELFKTPENKLTHADLERISKALADELSKGGEETRKRAAQSVRQTDSTTGVDMNPEQIKKCAAALGISEEEFTKKFVEGDALEKGKGGIAAMGHHLKKAIALHGKMHDMHKAMGEHHKQMAEHLQDCMKAHGACMDGETSEKVLKALIGEVKVESTTSGATITEDHMQKAINDAIAKATKELNDKVTKLESEPVKSPAQLFRVPREEMTKAASEQNLQDPIPVS